jgi:hypothetical protein
VLYTGYLRRARYSIFQTIGPEYSVWNLRYFHSTPPLICLFQPNSSRRNYPTGLFELPLGPCDLSFEASEYKYRHTDHRTNRPHFESKRCLTQRKLLCSLIPDVNICVYNAARQPANRKHIHGKCGETCGVTCRYRSGKQWKSFKTICCTCFSP